jgi:hypothetical protein
MSTLANTRVLPEALGDTYRRLHKVWNQGEQPTKTTRGS